MTWCILCGATLERAEWRADCDVVPVCRACGEGRVLLRRMVDEPCGDCDVVTLEEHEAGERASAVVDEGGLALVRALEPGQTVVLGGGAETEWMVTRLAPVAG